MSHPLSSHALRHGQLSHYRVFDICRCRLRPLAFTGEHSCTKVTRGAGEGETNIYIHIFHLHYPENLQKAAFVNQTLLN